jgi:hypothetical protein
MYFILTTFSTVGYGDYYPYSIAEKCAGIFLQVLGVTIFSVVINTFIEIISHFKDNDLTKNDDLSQWLTLCNNIRHQPRGDQKNITSELRKDIENHFEYYWENDRTRVIHDNIEIFKGIPYKI